MGLLSRFAARTLRALGFKAAGWDISHSSGAWTAAPRSPVLVARVAALAAGGRIVEFGCGNGGIASLLPQGSYSSYLGTDISPRAVKACADANVLPGVVFAVADMTTWPGETGGISLILCEECIYYLSEVEVNRFLTVCMTSLEPDGHVMLTFHSRKKHEALIAHIKAGWPNVEDIPMGDRVYLILPRDLGTDSRGGA